jgi:hypothetical protein
MAKGGISDRIRDRIGNRNGRGVNRRTLLIGGGAGAGLLVVWAIWPRKYLPNLTASPGETIFGAWLKIGEDGHVTVVVPQAEHGQGVYTTMPQIVADELGAASGVLTQLGRERVGGEAGGADAGTCLLGQAPGDPELAQLGGEVEAAVAAAQ